MPKGKGGNETQYRFPFIINAGSHPMNMYEVIILNRMSAWSRNVSDECLSSLKKMEMTLNGFEIL